MGKESLIQQLFEEGTDLIYSVYKLYFQNPKPAITIFVRLQYVVMIVRMYIQAHVAWSQLLMGEMAYNMTGYLSSELPTISFGQFGDIVEVSRAGEASLFVVPGFCFKPGGFYISFQL